MKVNWKRIWKLFLARFRLSESAICEMSIGKDLFNDYHDYPDDIHGLPWHFCELTCKRCGKKFVI